MFNGRNLSIFIEQILLIRGLPTPINLHLVFFYIGIQPFAAVEIFLHALHTRAHFFSLILRLGFEFFVVRNN